MKLLSALVCCAFATSAFAATTTTKTTKTTQSTVRASATRTNTGATRSTASAERANFAKDPFSNTVNATKIIKFRNTLETREGIRASLIRPMYRSKLHANRVGTDNTVLDPAWGVSGGYAKLPINQWGWTANLAAIGLEDDDNTETLVRAEGNMAFATNRDVHFRAGLNFSRFTSGEGESFDPRVGIQAGVGVQLGQNLGFDFSYVQMSQNGDIDDAGQTINVDSTQKGVEIAITALF